MMTGYFIVVTNENVIKVHNKIKKTGYKFHREHYSEQIEYIEGSVGGYIFYKTKDRTLSYTGSFISIMNLEEVKV